MQNCATVHVHVQVNLISALQIQLIHISVQVLTQYTWQSFNVDSTNQFRMLHTAGILSSALESAARQFVFLTRVAKCSHDKHSVMLPLQTDK